MASLSHLALVQWLLQEIRTRVRARGGLYNPDDSYLWVEKALSLYWYDFGDWYYFPWFPEGELS
jgi:hypothetical protein